MVLFYRPNQIRDNDTAGCTNVSEKGNLKNTLPPHDTLDPHVQLFQQANQQPHLPVMDRARDMLDRGTCLLYTSDAADE